MRAQRDLDRFLDSFFGRPMLRWKHEDGVRLPAVDLRETENEVLVTAELPGVDRKNLEVEVLPETLSLRAETLQESEKNEKAYHRSERVWGRFERTIPLPAEVVTDQVKAVLKDGVLEVRLPKTAQAKAATPKKIEIE